MPADTLTLTIPRALVERARKAIEAYRALPLEYTAPQRVLDEINDAERALVTAVLAAAATPEPAREALAERDAEIIARGDALLHWLERAGVADDMAAWREARAERGSR